ncbi:MAG: hypothetical protein PHW36_00835 [Bacilli bacterium]|nr:hypothetical protein [Bacilli bacterium]
MTDDTEDTPVSGGFIQRLYQDSVLSSAQLREWQLYPDYSRKGPFSTSFIPFYTSFVQLFQATCGLPLLEEFDRLKKRITTWIKRCEGIMLKEMGYKDRVISIGLTIYTEWTKCLLEKNIIILV